MSASNADMRIMRTDRCRCGEYPEATHDLVRGVTQFTCTCSRRGEEGIGTERAIYNWNQAVRRG